MGFASYREDIIKIRDDAAHFRRSLDNEPTDATKEANRHIFAYCTALDGIISQFDKLLMLATEPDIILADEVATLQDERDKAVAKAGELRMRLDHAKAERQQAEQNFKAKLAEQKAVASDLRKGKRQVEERFEHLAMESFAAAVAIYPPEENRR